MERSTAMEGFLGEKAIGRQDRQCIDYEILDASVPRILNHEVHHLSHYRPDGV